MTIKLRNVGTGEKIKFKLRGLSRGSNSWTWYGTYDNIPPSEGGVVVLSGKYVATIRAVSYDGVRAKTKTRVKVL